MKPKGNQTPFPHVFLYNHSEFTCNHNANSIYRYFFYYTVRIQLYTVNVYAFYYYRNNAAQRPKKIPHVQSTINAGNKVWDQKKPRHGITQPKQFNELYTQKHYAITLKNMINAFKTLFVLYLNYLFLIWKKCNLLFCVRRFLAVILLLLYNKRFYFFKEKKFFAKLIYKLKIKPTLFVFENLNLTRQLFSLNGFPNNREKTKHQIIHTFKSFYFACIKFALNCLFYKSTSNL